MTEAFAMKRKLHTPMAIEPLAAAPACTPKQVEAMHIQLVENHVTAARSVYADKTTGDLIAFVRVSHIDADTAVVREIARRNSNPLQSMGYCDQLSAVGARLSYINGTRKERRDSRKSKPITEIIEREIDTE